MYAIDGVQPREAEMRKGSGLQRGACVGLMLASFCFGFSATQGISAELGGATTAAGPGVAANEGLVAVNAMEGVVSYRTGYAMLPDFLAVFADEVGLEVQGLNLLERVPVESMEGIEPVPSLVQRLLEGYNYLLAFGDEGVTNPRGMVGVLVITGRKESFVTGGSLEPSQESTSDTTNLPGPFETGVGSEVAFLRESRAMISEGSFRGSDPGEVRLPVSDPDAVVPIRALMGTQLYPFATSRQTSVSDTGQGLAAHAGPRAQADGSGAMASEHATAELQEATQRALRSVQELARALKDASTQVSQNTR